MMCNIFANFIEQIRDPTQNTMVLADFYVGTTLYGNTCVKASLNVPSQNVSLLVPTGMYARIGTFPVDDSATGSKR